MDPVIFEDSPLATYFEGEGEGRHDWASVESDLPQQPNTSSFAPHGLSTMRSKLRSRFSRPDPLKIPTRSNTLSRLQTACTSVVSSGIGRREAARFLEQFRYPIIASQLLNNHTALTLPNPSDGISRPSNVSNHSSDAPLSPSRSFQGLFLTVILAFLVVCFWIAFTALATVATLLYFFARRRWLEHLRHQAIEAASTLISNVQAFDSVSVAALALIQEVELVSRGYNLSSPLPPVTRLEDGRQSRYCLRLRRNLSHSLRDVLTQFHTAHNVLHPLVQDNALERYYDMYEITQKELQEIKTGLGTDEEDPESLKWLKCYLGRLHSARKIVLCILLALEPDDTPTGEYAALYSAVIEMRSLASTAGVAAGTMTALLAEDENVEIASPLVKSPAVAKDQRTKAQLRRLNSLSQGIRALHAKIHLLREDAENVDQTDEETCLSRTLSAQYESVGADLKALLQEWEVGKATLMVNSERPKRFSSQSSTEIRSPLSPTFSLGGQTAVGGSPSEALKILNGESRPPSSIDVSDEEVFEAIAVPRQRSTLTRDERIAKMKEDRSKQNAARESREANTNMLRELETVIKLRPQARTSSRVTSV